MARRLLVLAEAAARPPLQQALVGRGFEVAFTADAERAAQYAGSAAPAGVVVGAGGALDPGVVVRRLRAAVGGATRPILLASPRYADARLGAAEVELAGADGFLAVPFEAAALEALLAATRKGHGRGDVGSLVDDLSARLDALDYYELLGVGAAATPAELKAAFGRRSLELHPDRVRRLGDAGIEERAYAVYKRIAEAFKVLSDGKVRAEYDAGLRADRAAGLRFVRTEKPRAAIRDPKDAARTTSGRRFFEAALLARRQGNAGQLKQFANLALQAEPGNADLQQALAELERELAALTLTKLNL